MWNRSSSALWVLAAAFWLLALVTMATGSARRLENLWFDWNLRLLSTRLAPDPDIVILDIDEATLAAMSREFGRYPWTRAVYGTLLEGLARQRPAAIVFDILFSDPHKEHVEDDLFFIDAARRLDNVYFPVVLLSGAARGNDAGFPLHKLDGAVPLSGADASAGAGRLTGEAYSKAEKPVLTGRVHGTAWRLRR